MSNTPQFGTAEYQPAKSGDQCKTCGQPITGQYFRVNNVMTCPGCAEKASSLLPKDTHEAFVRALICGGVGALVGLILYSVVVIITGWEIGYVSLAVGYIVGRAILLGSAGIGGRRYQVAAVILTYAAVSLSAVPITLVQMSKEDGSKAKVEQQADGKSNAGDKSDSSEPSTMGFAGAIVMLTLLGLASPLLNLSSPVSGLIGLLILFVGIRIAWTMTAGNKVTVAGPYSA